jgi:ribosome modulation factor
MLDKMYPLLYEEGYEARKWSEEPVYELCPYDEQTHAGQRDAWFDGWYDADSDLRTKYAEEE